MPMIHADGFDQWGNVGQMANNYPQATGVLVNDGTARTGRFYYQNHGATLKWTFPQNEKIAIVGAAIRTTFTNSVMLCQLGIITAAGVTVCIGSDSTGALAININGVLAQTAAKAILPNAWYYLEMLVDFTTQPYPFVEARINGQAVVSYTGPALADTDSAQFFIQSGNQAYQTWDTDDLVISAGDRNYPGDRHCFTLYPATDAAGNEWTVNGAATGAGCLSNTPPIDTDYIEADAAGQQSTFQLTALPGGVSSVLGVVVWSRAEKTDAGDCSYQPGFIVGAGEADGQERSANNNSPTWQEDIFFQNPLTGNPYTPADLGSGQGSTPASVTIKRTV